MAGSGWQVTAEVQALVGTWTSPQTFVPVAPTLSGGCLSLSSDAHFEAHPDACASTTSPTVTFAPVTATT
jgi:hypothetical protein